MVFITLTAISLTAQNQSSFYYWVKFKDKQHNPYSLNNPLQFLTQRSVDRRTNQGLALDSSDLPVTPAYIDSVLPYAVQLVHTLKWFNMIVVQVTDSTMARSIKSFSFVDSVAPIITYPYKMLNSTSKLEQSTPVNQDIVYPDVHGSAYHQINMMNGDLLHQLGYLGKGMLIAMMDAGWNGADTIHYFDSVRPRISDTWNFVANQPGIYYDPDIIEGGHGTETLGCIAANIPYQYTGTAPGASFVLYHTEDNTAEWVMEEYHWAAAAERADSMGAQIFSTSLSYNTFDDNIGNHTYADLNGNTTMITQASNTAASKGILVFNSVGNEGENAWYYMDAPADGDSVIAVGAVDSAGNVAAFSSHGPNSAGRIKPDLCAQGELDAVINSYGQLAVNSGTSFSCPILAGCAACLWQAFPNKTAHEIKDAIMASANHFLTPDNNHGYGIPNFYNAYLLLLTSYNGNILRLSDEAVVYPDPFTTQLNVSLYDSAGGTHTIELFDITGQKVAGQQLYIRQGTFELETLNGLGGLAEGEYFLRLDGQKKFTHPVVKMK